MNPLKEYPHLFANGIFKVKIKGFTNLKIQRYDCENNLFTLDVIHNEKKPKHCTLIARPKTDMTIDEWEKWNDTLKTDWGGDDIETKDTLIYLLSIGVYPFNQSHFGEIVININEI